MMRATTEERLERLERLVGQHDELLTHLRTSVARLADGQEKQAVAVNELSSQFGHVARELSVLTTQVDGGKGEMIAAMRHLSDHLGLLDASQKAFQGEWKGVCNARHEHVSYRLGRVEEHSADTSRELDDMSENSKVHYIQDLKAQLDQYEQRETQERQSQLFDERLKRSAKYKLAGAIITALLGGSGGAILFQWLLGGG
jgi:hypothetical protein